MKRNTRNAILKIAESCFCLAMLGSGIYGIVRVAQENERAEAAINRFENDRVVYEYIQEDMEDLNNRYDLGEFGYSKYRDELNNLKKDAATEIFGDEYQEARKNYNKTSGLIVAPLLVSAAGVGAVVAEIIDREDGALSRIADKIDETKVEKFEEKVIAGLNKGSEEYNIRYFLGIGKYDHNLIVKAENDHYRHVYFVYPTSTALELEDFNTRFSDGEYIRLYEISPKIRKQVVDIVSNVSPSYVGNEDGMLKHLNLREEKTNENN